MTTEERMLKNFTDKYGKKGLAKMCDMFLLQRSNAEIAKEFEVTRQRVHQWQKIFTTKKIIVNQFVREALESDK
jgi:predicted DNA-binding protein YlxM (UPF0122 family)